jgi:hypothetical protein
MYQSRSTFETHRIGAAAVYCSDGRYGEAMDEFLHEGLGLPRYDRVALPGGAACLGSHIAVWREAEVVSGELRFLIQSHELTRVILIAHEDCGFYRKRLGIPADEVERVQRADLHKAAARLRALAAGLEVECHFARRREEQVAFEAVP